MKKLLSYFMILIIILTIFLFQIYVIDGRELFGLKPNILLISVIVVSLWYGLYSGSIYGIVIGIITDSIYGNSFGIFTISYVVVGCVIGYMNYNYRKESKVSLIYLTILGTAIFEFMQYFIYLFLSSSLSNIFYLLIQIVISSLLNVTLAFILYGIFVKISKYAEDKLLFY